MKITKVKAPKVKARSTLPKGTIVSIPHQEEEDEEEDDFVQSPRSAQFSLERAVRMRARMLSAPKKPLDNSSEQSLALEQRLPEKPAEEKKDDKPEDRPKQIIYGPSAGAKRDATYMTGEQATAKQSYRIQTSNPSSSPEGQSQSYRPGKEQGDGWARPSATPGKTTTEERNNVRSFGEPERDTSYAARTPDEKDKEHSYQVDMEQVGRHKKTDHF